MKDFRGAVGVTVTPFTRDFQVDTKAVFVQAERLSQTAITAILPCASTGEFLHLTSSEHKAVYTATKQGNTGKKALFASACAPNLRAAISCVEMAAELKYDACVACPPYYYPLSQEEIYAFYSELSKAAGNMPIILYHVPFFTSGIEMATVERLLKLPGIIGIKDSSANMKRISHLCQLHGQRQDFLIYTGTDDCLLPALTAGCDGSMTALGASLPALVMAVYNAFYGGDIHTAQACQQRLMPLLKAADSLPFPLGYKLVAQVAWGVKMDESYHQMADAQKVALVLQEIEELIAEQNS